jgi:2-desacetyl-2-hydroxyethyl bacteriochlorophyllide A dehydrogenase
MGLEALGSGYPRPVRAFVITGRNAGEVRDVPVQEPQNGEALISVRFVGICGTDYHIFHGEFASAYPVIPGHEFSGTVAAVGTNAGEWHEGDRVTVDPSAYCGSCYHCLRRQANHCDNRSVLGHGMNGALAEYVRVPIRDMYRVEDHESLDEAAFTEPLACVLWGIERLRIRPSDRALIFGAGPIGALLTQMLHLSSASDIVVVDVAEEKLRVVAGLGAEATFVTGEDLPAQLDERSHGRKFDVVIDCTGIASVIEGTFAYAAPNARIMFFGVASPNDEIKVRPFDVYRNDWEILGSMAINYTFQQARDLLAAGRISVRPLITRVAALGEVAEILGRGKSGVELKTLVAPNPE